MGKLARTIARSIIHHLGNVLRLLYTLYLRSAGVTIGENTMISLGAKIDVRRGFISIGDNCLITHGSKILSHDGAMRLIDPGDDGAGYVRIGNNVFIGVNAIVLRNVTIGDNSVVGAGAVVTEDVPEGSVVIGNPAKIVKTMSGPFCVLNNPRHGKYVNLNATTGTET